MPVSQIEILIPEYLFFQYKASIVKPSCLSYSFIAPKLAVRLLITP